MPEFDAAALDAEVRALLAKETDRVDDPHDIPEDRAGWHAYRPIEPDARGMPYYDPEAWRWFALDEVGLVDEMAIVVFRWTDPATPDLTYVVMLHVDGLRSAGSAAAIVRGQLRNLLAPGWRDRVGKRWLSRRKVLVWRAPDPSAVHDGREQRRRADEEQRWRAPRSAPEETR